MVTGGKPFNSLKDLDAFRCFKEKCEQRLNSDFSLNSGRFVRVQNRILAKVWRASRAEFNSRARSLYGIGAAGGGKPIERPTAL